MNLWYLYLVNRQGWHESAIWEERKSRYEVSRTVAVLETLRDTLLSTLVGYIRIVRGIEAVLPLVVFTLSHRRDTVEGLERYGLG